MASFSGGSIAGDAGAAGSAGVAVVAGAADAAGPSVGRGQLLTAHNFATWFLLPLW